MITVERFKAHFSRDFPYLPVIEDDRAYFTGDIVYSGLNFYESLIDGNTNPVTDTEAWKLVNISKDGYLSDDDIEKAIQEAQLGIAGVFGADEIDVPLLYLTAFYLVLDIKNSTAGLSSNGYASFVASKSVGSVSESYGIPSWVNNDPMMALYLDNGYGKKYLTYLLPRARLESICILSTGGTTID